MQKSIYCGSFDCFHKGHANIVRRALNMFDGVTILVANNPSKKYTFTAEERVRIIKHTIEDDNITVDILPNSQLISDYAKSKGINTILKGIRDIKDVEYERMLHEITVAQEHGIDTCVLFANPVDAKISSSAVRELIKFNADVRDYVPLYTKQLLEAKVNKQYIIGVTGTIGSGKSYITKLLVNSKDLGERSVYGDITQRPINIDMDIIASELTYSDKYTWQNNHEVMELRNKIQHLLIGAAAESFPNIVKDTFASRIFKDDDFNRKVQQLYKPVMIREIRKRIAGKTGLILLNGALLIDCDMQYLCNNNVIVVDAQNSTLETRLLERYKSIDEVHCRLNSQLLNYQKINILKEYIDIDKHGKCVIIHNEAGYPVYDLPTEKEKQSALYSHLYDTRFLDTFNLLDI